MKKLTALTNGKKSKRILIAVGLVAVAAVSLLFVFKPAGMSANAQSDAPMTIALEKTDLVRTLSVSGVVKSSQTQNIYSMQTSPVQEIYVEVGDRVKAGDILARLDMSRVENDVKQAELNLSNARSNAAEETRANTNGVANAQTSLEASQLSLERQMLNAANAEKDLREAETNAEKTFDAYLYDKAIEDARINLERKTHDYENAQAEIYDPHLQQNAVNDAEKNYQRKQDDHYSASQNYYDALDRYNDAPAEAKDAAWANVVSTQNAMEAAGRAAEDAGVSLDRARADLTRTNGDLTKQENDSLTRTLNNLTDAERAYEKALSDKERAMQDHADNNDTKLENAQRAYADSQKQLESAQNSLSSAQNAYNQARNKPANSGVNISLQTLNLDKLNDQLAEGLIVATADGVITELNAKVGAAPSGILFVIEDVDRLYVSAKVKEYSLNELRLGQQGRITADAAIGKAYDAELTYISPKAVSPAGSTSVEFEIHAEMYSDDTDIKIGMNAFLDVVTDRRAGVYAVPLSAIVANERGSFIQALENGVITEIAVSTGLKTSTHVEIAGEGLYDGLAILAKPAR